ncbi:hypothetical protein V1264_024716 [Littorina saxatilis]|uniref:Uncharacterized protein n=1 Tax=Littorina saxatilis TaxID=31220 RepID=A0AAN9AM17_9CAEN
MSPSGAGVAAMRTCVKFCLLVLLSVTTSLSDRHPKRSTEDDANNFSVHVEKNGAYSLRVGNKTWLYSAPPFFNSDGVTYKENLKLKSIQTANGTDAFGKFEIFSFSYQAGVSEIGASIKTYEGHPFVLFSQVYLNGANNTRAANVNYAISGFPSFLVEDMETDAGVVGYLAYGGMMCGDTEKKMGIFSPDGFKITSGLAGGPVALFDGSGDTLVISPANRFMAASNWHSDNSEDGHLLQYGIMGGVTTVPANTVMEFIVYYSSGGINRAFEGWGSYLRQAYQRTDYYVRNDFTNNYLGYWTDNGAYYYYNTEQNKTYQQTMLDVKAYADQVNIPYRYWQYDSWWYYKGVGSGVKTWWARPDVFPDGFQYLYNKIGHLPATAHNRYWSSDTTYAKENGGKYNFVVGPMVSVPDDQSFWDDLFRNSSSWGLYTYEQDWLNKEFSGSEALLSDVDLGARWLNQMADGARKNNMSVQYCMANSRHIMQALENSVVTQARASDDYSPGSAQWKIGISSIFAYAMGIAPFKDDFWSTTVQPNNPYHDTEPHTELQLAASVLSTGPVAPSDMIGHTNVTLLMRCCNAEGLILKPSKPATAIDDQIYMKALSDRPGPDGEVWSTYSNVSGLMFGIIFVPEITGQHSITPHKAGFSQMTKTLMVYEQHTVTEMSAFAEESPLLISGCNTSRPCIYHATPVLKQNPTVVLLGELSKLVPVSPQRIISIDVGDDITMKLQGVPDESIDITFSVDSRLQTIGCAFGSSRMATLQLNARKCA